MGNELEKELVKCAAELGTHFFDARLLSFAKNRIFKIDERARTPP